MRKSTRTRALVLGALALALAGGLAWWTLRPPSEATTWKLVTVERQDVRATVQATGILEAVTQVEVGTQVSGVIQELLVDYNDQVTEGQVVARIDPTLLQADVDSARASLAVRQAELAKAEQDLKVTEGLHGRQAATDTELADARTALTVARAQVRQSRVSVERAERNLSYATIPSPIAGTVVERDVEVGQTVNAGMTAPRLFLIAGDLAQMQILASVDESDIGRVKEGQPVEFTVQAFPRDTFKGTVRQVRLQSTTVDAVVTYTVVVAVDNADGRLLPGMTATVDLIVAEEKDRLCVANAALRFSPTEAQVLPGAAEAAPGEAAPAEASAAGPAKAPNGKGGRRRGGGDGKGTVWLAASETQVQRVSVKTGITDGSCTVIEEPVEGLAEGIQVVAGVELAGAAEASAAAAAKGGSSPFQQSSAGANKGPGPPSRPGGF